MIERLKRLLARRSRISTQLYIGIGGAVALTVAASLVGWFSFDRVGDAQSDVNEGRVPEVVAAFGVARYSSALVAAAPRLTAAATPEDFALASDEITVAHEAFEEELAVLEQRDADDERFERIRSRADTLLLNIEAIKSEMSEVFELTDRREALQVELMGLRARLDEILLPAIDDQLFYTITGYRELGDPPADRQEHFTAFEFGRYGYLAELQADANIATQLLASAFSLSDASFIEPLRERFEAATSRIERSLSALEESPFRAEVASIFAQLFELGIGEQSGFDLFDRELRLAAQQVDLLARNRDLAVELVAEVDGLVGTANIAVQEATRASSQATLTGRTLLLAISAISIGGAFLIAWLYVGRVLLRRLELLSGWMLRMAGGDLESRVEIKGRDEVADMAAALEVFRRHALEVQRLNLVEKLAEEVQGKNAELERVLVDLRRAQDQIVTREKLAALGELTAGVAHEIKNPLNFVKNFSEASEELLTELGETLEESSENLAEDQRVLIQEISSDLTSNLERIRSHGERANRIVQDMLAMGRGSGERRPADINRLLDEHARLAYHSARATDSNFQLDIQQDLDPDLGELEVIPQDLGRVFLNMVGNACDATDERRRAAKEAGEGAEPYAPTLWLSTRRGEDQVVIRIKDNGSGIPPDVVEKIFNPFFTTKPTDQGTGLGLALSSDIVRQHGGTIRVESEPGQFTEMVIELPLVPPPVTTEDDAEDESPTVTGPDREGAADSLSG